MAKKKNLCIEQRASVVTKSKENYSGRATARKLKISLCAVQGILKKDKENGSVIDRTRSGTVYNVPKEDKSIYSAVT